MRRRRRMCALASRWPAPCLESFSVLRCTTDLNRACLVQVGSPQQQPPSQPPPASGAPPPPPMESHGFQEVPAKSRCAQPGAWATRAGKALEVVAAPALAPPSAAHAARPARPSHPHRPQEADAPAPAAGAERGCWRGGAGGAHRSAPHRCDTSRHRAGLPAGSPSRLAQRLAAVTWHLAAAAPKRASAPLLALQPSLRRPRPA